MKKKRIVLNDKEKIASVIKELDEKKNEALRNAWKKVNKVTLSVLDMCLTCFPALDGGYVYFLRVLIGSVCYLRRCDWSVYLLWFWFHVTQLKTAVQGNQSFVCWYFRTLVRYSQLSCPALQPSWLRQKAKQSLMAWR